MELQLIQCKYACVYIAKLTAVFLCYGLRSEETMLYRLKPCPLKFCERGIFLLTGRPSLA